MASLHKLSVRGVRSFSPDDIEQVITFEFPLTIIVGDNGCGKTTIIESLKYAVTGSLPPGNKSGQAFVNDPRACGRSSVKASVKLRFANRAGKTMVAIRSMEVTQNKKTLSFKALDGIIRTTDDVGNRVSLSHRCSELNQQIPALLGVNKPVLEHVVFCHQEDASWPLMEGAILKKRFDEIFDSTKYALALVEIRSNKKKYQDQAKELKVELAALASHRHAAENYRAELETVEMKLADLQDRIEEYKRLAEKEDTELERHKEVFVLEEGLQEQLREKEKEIDVEKKNASNVKRMLGDNFLPEVSDSELDKMNRNFDDTVMKDREAYDREMEEFKKAKATTRLLESRLREAEHHSVRLVSEEEAHGRVREEREVLVRHASAEHGLGETLARGGTQGDSGGALVESELSNFLGEMRSRMMDLQEAREEKKRKIQVEEDRFQEELVELKAKANNNENESKQLKGKQIAARKENREISLQQSKSTRIRKSDIDEARQNAESKIKLREEITRNPRRIEIPQLIKENENKMSASSRAVNELTHSLLELRRCANENNAIAVLEDQVARDTSKLNEDVEDARQDFQSTGIRLQSSDLACLEQLVETHRGKIEEANASVKESTEEHKTKQKTVTESAAMSSHSQRSIMAINTKLSELGAPGRGVQRIKSVISEVIAHERKNSEMETVHEGIPVQDLSKHLSARIRDLSEEYDDPATIRRILKRLLKKNKRKDVNGNVLGVACPCCDRDMNAGEYNIFKEKMAELMDHNGEFVQLYLIQVQESQKSKEKFEEWRSIVTEGMNDWMDHSRLMKELVELEDDALTSKANLKTQRSDLKICYDSLLIVQDDLNDLERNFREAQRLRAEASRIDERKLTIETKKEQLRFVAPSSGGRSLREVEQDIAKHNEEKETAINTIASLNKECSSINDRLSEATNRASQSEKLASEKEAQFNKEQENNQRKQVLSETIMKCDDEIKNLCEQAAPLRQDILAKENDKTRRRSAANTEDTKLGSELDKFRADFKRIEALTHNMSLYLKKGIKSKLVSLKTNIKTTNEKICAANAEVAAREPSLAKLKDQLNNQQRLKKKLEDNIMYRSSLKSIDVLENELKEVQKEMEELGDLASLRDVMDEVYERKQNYSDDVVRSEGRISGQKEQKNNLKRRLNTEAYYDIDERHRTKMIQHETSLICVTDLDKFYNAVDKSLLQFHGLKIEDINKIIKELWTLTYRGEDINCIEIVSGQDTGSRAARSYNYRVVMTKGTTKIDMRGRCSAGQRVLASIVIRLALAETFCINCGVLALDEPTTNLDHENKKGLAQSLAQIISNRSVQRNFQLVVITHDEDFVLMMKDELQTQANVNLPEHYFQLSRERADDGKFYSKIRPVSWEEL